MLTVSDHFLTHVDFAVEANIHSTIITVQYKAIERVFHSCLAQSITSVLELVPAQFVDIPVYQAVHFNVRVRLL